MPFHTNVSDRKFKKYTKTGRKLGWGLLITVPTRLIITVCSIFFILLLISIGLFVTKIVHDNYDSFQENLKKSPELQNALITFINTILAVLILFQRLLLFAIEILDYAIPAINLAVYIFFKIGMSLLLTIFGQGNNQQNDAGDMSMPMRETPDPQSTLSAGLNGFLDTLVCILLDVMTFLSGCAKVYMKALGAILMVVFQWIEENQKESWYRKEYCRIKHPLGASDGSSTPRDPTDDPSTPNPNNPNQKIFSSGTGPGSTCPDNKEMIQGLIRMIELVVNILRDVIIQIFPLLAELCKMIFDSILKILPQLMDGFSRIISLFSPDQPLGKLLMFLLNYIISIIGLFFRSCILQFVISYVMCFFGGLVVTIINIIKGIIQGILEIVCLGGLLCNPKVGGEYLQYSSCNWTSVSKCANQSYDSKQQDVKNSLCQVSTCSSKIKSTYHGVFRSLDPKSKTLDRQVDHYSECLKAYSRDKGKDEDLVRGHIFCKELGEHAFRSVPLGHATDFDPHEDDSRLCQNLSESCLCKYGSPICESQTCCLSFYQILITQILSDMDVKTCGRWKEKRDFANLYCVARIQRSLELGMRDLLGTSTHCDGFVSLGDQSCIGSSDNSTLNVLPMVGGMCNYVDDTGFCDDFRRPSENIDHLEDMAQMYNEHLEREQEIRKHIVLQHAKAYARAQNSFMSRFDQESMTAYASHLNKLTYVMQDHYTVAMTVMVSSFPIIRGMVISSINPSYGNTASARLDPSIHTSKGKLRSVRVRVNERWKDYEGKHIHGIERDNMPMRWTHSEAESIAMPLGDTYGGECTNTGGYPSGTSFKCINEKQDSAADAAQGSITQLTSPNHAQDQLSNIKSNSSDQVDLKTTQKATFDVANRYVDIMYTRDMDVPAGWKSSDAARDNQNPNWKVPLVTRVNITSTSGTPSFTIYDDPDSDTGDTGSKGKIPMDRCPIQEDFPWEKVFKKRNSYSNPIARWMQNMPDILDLDSKHFKDLSVPKHITDGLHLMYKRRNTDLTADAHQLLTAGATIIKHAYSLPGIFYDIRKELWSPGSEDTPHVTPFYQFLGLSPNPQSTKTSLCVNRLLSAYECCTDESTAYECCYGLVGCIPPFEPFKITLVKNVDFILNAQCGGTSNVVLSMLFLPRMFLSTFLWTFIFICPEWSNPMLFQIFYPLIYDSGGKGVTYGLLGEIFCFIVNMYYFMVVAAIFMGVVLVNNVVFSFTSEMHVINNMGHMSVEIAMLREDIDREKEHRITTQEKRDNERDNEIREKLKKRSASKNAWSPTKKHK